MDAYQSLRASPAAAAPLPADAEVEARSSHAGTATAVAAARRRKTRSERSDTPPTPRGSPRPLSKHFLAKGFAANSYFAQRLRVAMYGVALLALGGLSSFWLIQKRLEDGGLYVGNVKAALALEDEACENPWRGSCGSCRVLVIYAMFEYHLLPAAVLIGLPATGWRVFEPFKRANTGSSSGAHSKHKVTRSGYLQFCEVLCTFILAAHSVIGVYFVFSLTKGNNFTCALVRVHLYACGAFLAYLGVLVEIAYFARFREHVKMQLGAFHEGDQTGNIRGRLEPKKKRFESELGRVTREVRKGLFKETKLGNVRNIENLLAYAQTRLGDDFADEMYRNASIVCKWFGRSKKNPVHAAAYHGNLQALELLVRAGFGVNSLDKVNRVRFSTGDMFWHFASFVISRPKYDAVDGSSRSVFKTTLVTPLHCAVVTGQIGAVRWLLDHGADPNARSRSSYWSERIPPLFVAENPEIVTLLLEAGANQLEVPDPGHMNTLTVLQVAYLRGNIPVARVLERWGGDVALTPLHEAAAADDMAGVRRLVGKGADPNCVGENGYCGLYRRTPLHWGAVNGAVRAVEVLLAAGADPNFQDNQGRTPLHWAAAVNRPAVVKVLLEAGADPHVRDWSDMTPLLCASVAKDVPESLFDCLVQHGADINEELRNGDTGLHLAMKCEQQQTALALLAAGGDIMKTNDDGYRPVDCTTSTTLQFELKRAAGTRDVMISYTHSHAEFARKLRQSLEDANVTTWLDLMDPSGIGGGSVWREEIARGIKNAAMVVCVLTEDYPRSEWCLKELALAKESGTPIIAISTENVVVTDDLQVYLYTRQTVPFEPAICRVHKESPRSITYEYDAEQYDAQFRLLLDGVRDEIEKQRKEHMARGHRRRGLHATSMLRGSGAGGSAERVGIGAMSTVGDDGVGVGGAAGVDVGGSAGVGGGRTAGVDGAATGVSSGWDLATLDKRDFVFISHGEQHHWFAQRLFERLKESGVACVLDGAQASADMNDRIFAAKEAILRCATFVVVISSKTVSSELVKDQLAFAEDKGKPLLPIMLNETEIGLDKHYTLSRGELFHFTPELGFNASFSSLLARVRQYVPAAPGAGVGVGSVGGVGGVGIGIRGMRGIGWSGGVGGHSLLSSSFVAVSPSPDVSRTNSFRLRGGGGGGDNRGGVSGGVVSGGGMLSSFYGVSQHEFRVPGFRRHRQHQQQHQNQNQNHHPLQMLTRSNTAPLTAFPSSS